MSKSTELRGKIAASKRWTPNVDTTQLERELAAAKLTAYIEKVVESAPPLSREQKQRIADLLLGGADVV